ncbi:double-strand-break repair protein rad21 homolog isoform X2 [Mercenaria mercenaria]|uniref:double-strand-break repair protein rad21 homolog isoform X2 n=1 Tax=Mercenaria mercenaria TaxID=6596 RepID=UPI001E1DC3EA|nr:double-strand-break repair protein rad21 homolog isoform X2 [Mercenaria mercenaria]
MFYAHFVLTKKGPLARIWLAAHWDKKLTKAHVFETNIDSSVEAIMKPKVKLALRTSGHLLLGVVRIYSRKAKYLLADCNEAFVKIKMAFRPGVVDLPEENREANVAAITLQENFHDFDALEDLHDIDMSAQFSTVNQSRPEEITMKEDLTTISFVGDDSFGDVGFDERELLRDAHFDDTYLKSPRQDISMQHIEKSHSMIAETSSAPTMDVDLPPLDDGFGGGGFMDIGNDDDDDDNDADSFGGGVDQEFLGEDLITGGNLFEDTPAVPPEIPVTTPLPQQKDVPEQQQLAAPLDSMMTATPVPGTSGEQTTLITNENEAFALEPLDTTHMPGVERKKRKRKLIVDEQQGIPSETMKMQLSDTSDIVTTLDLAPPTKKLMQWKETGGFEKLFALPGCAIRSRNILKMFKRNMKTRPSEDFDENEERLELEAPEISREEDRSITEKSKVGMSTIRPEISTIMEESSILETSKRSRRSDESIPEPPAPKTPRHSSSAHEQQPNVSDIFGQSVIEPQIDLPEVPSLIQPHYEDEGPPSIAPFSVGPASVGPPSVGPISFGADVEGGDQMPEDEEQEEQRWTKRTEQMQHTLDQGFRYTDELSFKDMARKLNRKQVTSKFYTLLVLKKHKVVEVNQTEPFGDILIGKGPKFGMAC